MASTLHMCNWERMDVMSFNALIYWAFFLLYAIRSLYPLLLQPNTIRKSTVLASMGFLTASAGLHAIWCTLRACAFDDFWENLINRFALLCLFTGFSLYLETWAIFLYATWPSGVASEAACGGSIASRRKYIKLGLRGVNTVFWIVVLSLSIVFFYGVKESNCDFCYDAGIILMSMASSILAILFLIFGFSMYSQLYRLIVDDFEDPGARLTIVKLRTAMKKVLIVGSITAANFCVKAVFFLRHPVTHTYSERGTYPWLFYTVVELVPISLLFSTVAPERPKGREDTAVVNGNGCKQEQKERASSVEEGLANDGWQPRKTTASSSGVNYFARTRSVNSDDEHLKTALLKE
mmetsp:Transcript_41926/g.67420  ORF Transcript_41926/g.67420 Transcript_41926/m.67420 type:complete len:350 (-) Transcript_41926:191-1240(-)